MAKLDRFERERRTLEAAFKRAEREGRELRRLKDSGRPFAALDFKTNEPEESDGQEA